MILKVKGFVDKVTVQEDTTSEVVISENKKEQWVNITCCYKPGKLALKKYNMLKQVYFVPVKYFSVV